MDVIISAPQGGGKTTAAMILATGYLNASSWNQASSEVLVMSDEPSSPTGVADLIESYEAKAVIFDGSITGPDALRIAIEGVKIYRQRHERTPSAYERALLAIYCEQRGVNAVVLQFPNRG